jgi:Sec-independent protein secretion pathway component TatC
MTDDAGRRHFGFWVLGLWVAAFIVSAVATPPDPFSQILTLVPLLLIGVLGAYVAVYRLGW